MEIQKMLENGVIVFAYVCGWLPLQIASYEITATVVVLIEIKEAWYFYDPIQNIAHKSGIKIIWKT